ncbi:unnamed protein product [Brachionus calyciflorus]|uniref:Uncharacterized protein n=1 Tax=Brachionus calyciflorus TaxID=104777 RepID=A0A813M5J6_9BILA|nr:unnamed protein product [Brachionus calyciflorus]
MNSSDDIFQEQQLNDLLNHELNEDSFYSSILYVLPIIAGVIFIMIVVLQIICIAKTYSVFETRINRERSLFTRDLHHENDVNSNQEVNSTVIIQNNNHTISNGNSHRNFINETETVNTDLLRNIQINRLKYDKKPIIRTVTC